MTDSQKPAGWYHAAGDPPGSHRYWDGSRWQGEPRMFGEAAAGATGTGATGATGAGAAVGGTTDTGAAGAPATAHVQHPPMEQAQTAPSNQSFGGYGSEQPAVTGYQAPAASNEMVNQGISAQESTKGFLASLFDVSFSSFITNRAISVIYTLVLVLIGLTTLILAVAALSRGIGGILTLLIIIPAALFYLVMIRLTLEFFVNQFRQTELMEKIAAKGSGE